MLEEEEWISFRYWMDACEARFRAVLQVEYAALVPGVPIIGWGGQPAGLTATFCP